MNKISANKMAQKLFNNYLSVIPFPDKQTYSNTVAKTFDVAKICAIIQVNAILECTLPEHEIHFWKQVLTKLEKL